MTYFIIKKDRQKDYPNLKAFVKFPSYLCDVNLSKDFYYYWRLKERSNDEMILTKIKIEDLESVKL